MRAQSRWMVALAIGASCLAAPAGASAASAPAIEREAVRQLTPTEATLTAVVDPGELETSYEVEMTGSCPEHHNGEASCELIWEIPVPGGTIAAGSGPKRLTIKLSRVGVTLAPGDQYGFSISVSNALGKASGGWQSFDTPSPAGAPAIYSESVSHITPRAATLSAKIDPQGAEAEYELWLSPGCREWFCERGPAHVVASGRELPTTVARSVHDRVANLPPGTPENEFWFVVRTAGGTSEGISRRFTTPSL